MNGDNLGENIGSDISRGVDTVQNTINGAKSAVRTGKRAVKAGKAAAKATVAAAKATAHAISAVVVFLATNPIGWAIDIFLVIVFLVILLTSMAGSAFNEAFDVDHYARDDEVKTASVTHEGETTAQTEEEIVAGYQVVRSTVKSAAGINSITSTSSTTAGNSESDSDKGTTKTSGSADGTTQPDKSKDDGAFEYDSVWMTCAYDTQRGNYEDLFEKDSGTILSGVKNWFTDLATRLGSDVLMTWYAMNGTDIKIYERDSEPVSYPTYTEKTVDGQTYYVESGTATTSETIEVDNYDYVKTTEDGTKLYQKNGTTTITPSGTLQDTGETEEVKGFGKKAVFLKSLGLEPNAPYRDNDKISNLEYADSLYDNLTASLTLPNDTSGSYSGSYYGSYIWPIARHSDAAARAQSITSLKLRRSAESTGGVGSTDHGGIDIGAYTGEEVLAVADGTVIMSEWYGGYGNFVGIDHGIVDGQRLCTYYGHNSQLLVSVGQTVKQGDVIAYAGSTGNSTGPHVHLEFRLDDVKQDPLDFYTKSYVAGYTNDDYNNYCYVEGKAPEGVQIDESKFTSEVLAWKGYVEKAMGMLGMALTTENVEKILTQMTTESSGIPDALQSLSLKDINMGTTHAHVCTICDGTMNIGHGLMQVIPSTFEECAIEGYNTNIVDPMSNILAGLNHMITGGYYDPTTGTLSGIGEGHGY